MRRFIFILIILLLPLRGWMGEAMATEMATMNLVAAQAVNTPATANLADSNSMADCDMHKTKTADNKPAKALCTHCQACHASGIASTVEINSFDKIHYAQPLLQVHAFTSASLALGQKPPIL